jgi:hypothetical protein
MLEGRNYKLMKLKDTVSEQRSTEAVKELKIAVEQDRQFSASRNRKREKILEHFCKNLQHLI